MILPTKRLNQDRSLLYVGAEILHLLNEPKTVSRLWQEVQFARSEQLGLAPLQYDWFVLALDLLFLVNAIKIEPGRIRLDSNEREEQGLLKAGMGSSNKVRDYFGKHHDPKLGDRIAQAFRGEYEALRNANLTPDDVFARLQLIGNGIIFATPSRQAATLTVLASLFEECDIFERPPEEALP